MQDNLGLPGKFELGLNFFLNQGMIVLSGELKVFCGYVENVFILVCLHIFILEET